MAMFTAPKTSASEISSPLSLLSTALLAVTPTPLALLALMCTLLALLALLLSVLALMALLIRLTLLALPITPISLPGITRTESLSRVPLMGTLLVLTSLSMRWCPTGTVTPGPALLAGLSCSLAPLKMEAVILAM
jgi:hypothetical protein